MAGREQETSPLLQHNHSPFPQDDSSSGLHDKRVVDFDPVDDSDNPRHWPTGYKWTVVWLLAIFAFTISFTCAAVAPVAAHIVTDLDGNRRGRVLLVTIWELGEAAGPLVIAPLSELFGRYPVINTANVAFTLMALLSSFVTSTPMIIVIRFLTGLSVATNVLNPAITFLGG